MEQKPEWLKVPYNGEAVREVTALMQGMGLNTVCREANCPNLGECYKKRTATFMVLGSHCTRNCRFCNVTSACPTPPDPEEPMRLAAVAARLGLRHVVITQVTRDDLPDGGSAHMASVIRALHTHCPEATVEILASDMQGDHAALDTMLQAHPDVFNHNMEVPEEWYKTIRPEADYHRSLDVLRYCAAHAPDIRVKTGFMVGLGETDAQIDRLMDDILDTGCSILTIGQYLQPSPAHAPLRRYVTLEEFDAYRRRALEKGFRYVASSPLVRSSYRAAEAYEACKT